MKTIKLFAHVVCWQYWKQLQRFLEDVGQLTHMGFIFPKFQDYEYKRPFTRNPTKINGVFW